MLEAAQQSIVGLVVTWEEAIDPFTPFSAGPQPPEPEPDTPDIPVFGICTGYFDSPTTIVTAGHCVDPVEGRMALHAEDGPRDEEGWPTALPPTALEPKRTVWAFQPRETPGAVLTAPVIVRVDDLRGAENGDIAKLTVAGMPPARPLPTAAANPRLGESVTSIGFPGLNIGATDGVDVEGLFLHGKSPAEVLQDSRLHPSNTSGTITAQQFRQGVPVYQVNSDLGGGMSGGPTLNSRGEVLGLNSQMTVPFIGQNFNVITDTDMLREFLERPAEAQPAPAPPQASAPVPAPVAAAPIPAAVTGQVNAPAATSSPITSDLPLGWLFAGSVLGGVLLGLFAGVRFQRARIRRASADPAPKLAADSTPDPIPTQA